jgi:hypothetical protein
MNFPRSYLLKVLSDALEEHQEVTPPTTLLPGTPGAPEVAPPDAAPFSAEVMQQLEYYRGKALLVQDFEGFMALINTIANELKLNPAQDLPKIAGVFNSYRVTEGLEPL